MQCWKGREKELKSFLFCIVGIAPLHLWIFLIYFPGLCDCENLQGAKVQCWKACITIFLLQIVWIAGSISEFSQSVWGFGSVWLWVPKIRAQNQYDFCGHARVHPEYHTFLIYYTFFFLLIALWSRHVKPSSAKGEKRLKRKKIPKFVQAEAPNNQAELPAAVSLTNRKNDTKD